MKLSFYEQSPASSAPPKQLAILLHGYGASGLNLITLASEFLDVLADCHFFAPNAPFPFEGGGDAFQWYSLADRRDEVLLAQAKIAEPILNAFIDEQLHRFNLTDKDLIVMGFSQGGMMTMHTMYRRKQPSKAVVSFSGYMSGTNVMEHEIKSKPPILLCHGNRDTVVPHKAMAIAGATLRKLGVDVTEHSVSRLGHSIDYNCINAVKDFLKKHTRHENLTT